MNKTGTHSNASNSLHILCSGVIYDSTFDSPMSTRSWSDASREYRYGFNGKEKDFETANDNFPIAIGIGARIYDGRLGRWLSEDQKKWIQPFVSPYKAIGNNPIVFIDPDGNYEFEIIKVIDKKTGQTIVMKKIISDKIMTDGKSSSGWYDENYYYDYASKVTTRVLNEDGTIAETTETDVILYENGVQDMDAVFFGGEEKGYTKKDWGTLFDEGIRKQYQEGGFVLASSSGGVSQTKYYSKSDAKHLDLDALFPMLKMGKSGVVKNIFEGMSTIGSTEEYIEELIKLIKEKSTDGTPDGTGYCRTCKSNYKNDKDGKITPIPSDKEASDTVDNH